MIPTMKLTATGRTLTRHPRMRVGPAIAVYVWQYPLRLVHWGLVLCIGALSFTGYYIHNPFIVGQTKTPFLMGWFRFAHEAFGMAFIAFFLLRLYLFFAGDRWARWQAMVPLHKRAVEGNDRGDEVLRLHPSHAGLEGGAQRHGRGLLHRDLCAGAGGDPHGAGDVQLAARTARS